MPAHNRFVSASSSPELGAWDDSWLDRSQHWLRASEKARLFRGRRDRRAEPLILAGHGVTLRIDKGTLLIRDGFTHYPQQRREFRFFKGDLSLPDRIVVVDGSGSLSFDVLSWLSEQRVSLVRIDWKGDVVSVIGGSGFAADRDLVRWQTELRNDPRRRLAWSIDLIARKIRGAIETLDTTVVPSVNRENAVAQAWSDLNRLAEAPPRDVGALRVIEANSAAAYFRSWKGMALRWKGTYRRPIPDAWRTINSRRSLANETNRNATHPINAMLNYSYGMLQSQVQIACVAQGYDPTLGIMHEQLDGRPSLAFDLMEVGRPVVDRAVLGFVRRTTFDPADFVMNADGGCRLNPQLANRVVQMIGTVDLPEWAPGLAPL